MIFNIWFKIYIRYRTTTEFTFGYFYILFFGNLSRLPYIIFMIKKWQERTVSHDFSRTGIQKGTLVENTKTQIRILRVAVSIFSFAGTMFQSEHRRDWKDGIVTFSSAFLIQLLCESLKALWTSNAMFIFDFYFRFCSKLEKDSDVVKSYALNGSTYFLLWICWFECLKIGKSQV